MEVDITPAKKQENYQNWHSLYCNRVGQEYIKFLQQKGIIESEITLRILKSSISIMESFNNIRNNQSLAHDNEILNYNESHLVFKTILNCIEYLNILDTSLQEQDSQTVSNNVNEEYPF
jgi:hypothetical protein